MRARGIVVVTAAIALLSACGGDGSDDSSAAGDGDFCSVAYQLTESVDAVVTNADEATFDKIEATIDQARDRAPAEIDEDLDTLAEGFSNVRAVFAQYDFDVDKVMAAAADDPELFTKLVTVDEGEVEAAGNRVEAYVKEHCGGATVTGATTPPSG
jgi:hypothetical protein